MEGAPVENSKKNDVKITTKLWKNLWKKMWKTKNDVKITTKKNVKITTLIPVKIIKDIDLLKIRCIIASNADPRAIMSGGTAYKKIRRKYGK